MLLEKVSVFADYRAPIIYQTIRETCWRFLTKLWLSARRRYRVPTLALTPLWKMASWPSILGQSTPVLLLSILALLVLLRTPLRSKTLSSLGTFSSFFSFLFVQKQSFSVPSVFLLVWSNLDRFCFISFGNWAYGCSVLEKMRNDRSWKTTLG